MIRHHYTLELLAQELTSLLAGHTLVEAWTQEKYTIAMVFAINDELRTFVIDTSPNGGTCSEQPNLRRARSNTLGMLRAVWQSPLALVTKHPDDRVLTFWFPEHQLHCEFFSSGNGNIVCVHDGVVIESLRDAQERCRKAYAINAPRNAGLWEDETLTIQQSLARCSLKLGPWYAEEVCRRAAIDGSSTVSSLPTHDRERVATLGEVVRAECRGTSSVYLLARAEARLLSLIPLPSWDILATYAKVLDGTRAVLRERHRVEALRIARQEALRTTTTELERAKRTLAAITSDIVRDSRSARYRIWADALLTYHHPHEKNLTSIDLDDTSGERVTIPLNPNHSIIENATRLYNKARSAEVASVHREQRVPQLEATIASLEQRRLSLEQATSIAELEALAPRRMEQHNIQPRDESGGRFRFFILDEQHCLYVGKNAANNDELTMKFAKQNDWWLHARGSAGSHAVLRGVDGDRIPKPILEQAAAITAYYSQARNASWVSVVYTQRKHVRKPKGANVGAVVLEREQTVMVKPAIPT